MIVPGTSLSTVSPLVSIQLDDDEARLKQKSVKRAEIWACERMCGWRVEKTIPNQSELTDAWERVGPHDDFIRHDSRVGAHGSAFRRRAEGYSFRYVCGCAKDKPACRTKTSSMRSVWMYSSSAEKLFLSLYCRSKLWPSLYKGHRRDSRQFIRFNLVEPTSIDSALTSKFIPSNLSK